MAVVTRFRTIGLPALVTRFATIGLLALLVSGCSTESSSPADTAATVPATVPATVAGTVPAAVAATVAGTVTADQLTDVKVLVFHRTAGFAHESIPAGVASLTEMGAEGRFAVTATEDPSVFTDDSLAAFQVIVFLNTTGDILLAEQEQAMERFIRSGGGFVGIHAAADTEYDWAWYGGLVGASFKTHPAPQPGRVEVLPVKHPVSAGVPPEFVVEEEWYDFQAQPGPSVTVLATVDEGSYTGGTMGWVHPIVWAHEYDGGRAAYLGFGHDATAFGEPTFRLLLGQAIEWTAG